MLTASAKDSHGLRERERRAPALRRGGEVALLGGVLLAGGALLTTAVLAMTSVVASS